MIKISMYNLRKEDMRHKFRRKKTHAGTII
jgi:hypothetical protein